MKRRKTVQISKLIEMANDKFAADSVKYPKLNREYRIGLQVFIENILHEYGVYSGFGYLSASMLDNPNEQPGINTMRIGNNDLMYSDHETSFKDTDNSRIFFIDRT